MTDLDLTKLSDDDLRALHAQRQRQPPPPDLTRLSDDDLRALYAQRRGQSAPAQAPAQAPATAPQTGMPEAVLRGAAKGATFNLNDEIEGLRAAAAAGLPEGTRAGPLAGTLVGGARLLGEWAAPGVFGSKATEAYGQRAGEMRARDKLLAQEHPYAHGAAEFIGGAAVPFGAGAQGVKGLMKVGAGAGAITGFGAGEGAIDSAVGAGVGAGLGGAIGAGLPLLARGAGAAANMTGIPQMVRGAANPTRQAEREVAQAFLRDLPGSAPRLDPSDFRAAQADFQPVVVADLGGENVRTLARAATDVSAEAASRLKGVTEPRYAAQADRFRNFLDDLYGGPNALDNTRLGDDLHAAARSLNRPAYDRAYDLAAARGVQFWDDRLHTLTGAPEVQKAMRDVERRSATEAVLDGYRPIRNPFQFDKDGAISWRTTEDGGAIMPNLEFWDMVKRNLDDQARGLTHGSNERRGVEGLARALRDHLDALAPEYGMARSGAAKFFDADDALQAGQNFISASKNIAITDAAKALRQMDDVERGFFERGFVTELMRRTQKDGNVARVFDNPTLREKIGMVMGDQRAGSLEAFARRETIMQILKERVGGGSDTARKLHAALHIGGAGTLGGAGGAGLGFGDPTSMTIGSIAAALTRAGQLRVRETVAREVAEILASTDPSQSAMQ